MRFRLGFLVVLLALSLSGTAHASGDAREVIQVFCDRLLDVMKHGPQLGYQGRQDKLRPAVAEAYDMSAMTRGTLGPAANKLTPEESTSLADTFSRFSVATYAEQFNDWDGEKFEVGEPHASTNGMVVVPSRIVPKTGGPVEIDYLMREDQGHWRIVDVLFDGSVSQVAVRRSEFVPILRKKGASGLIEMLDRQTSTLGQN
jgi:phospholipid transport system substrate-binding protein